MITLSVDDRLPIAQQVADMMKGIDPEGQHNAEDNQENALIAVDTVKPDIIWLDIEMPGINGLKMATEIKKRSPDTNIVFVTGFPEYAIDAFGLHVSGYLLKPVTAADLRREIDNLRVSVERDNDKLRIKCFGNFEVFYHGKIVRFSRSMSKEALAYLVDRRGAGCTVSEICSVLWEDRQADANLKSQCRVVMAALKRDLASIGADDIIIKMWNTWSIDASRISCDYYDFLQRENSAINSFRGEYMSQYSWAEMTVGNLYDMSDEMVTL